MFLTKFTVDFEMSEEDVITILTDQHTHEEMMNKYEAEQFITIILNCKRATDFVQQNKHRLPTEADFFQMYKILAEGVLDVSDYNNYRTFLPRIKVRRLFEKRVHGGMNEAEIIKLIKPINKARPFWVFNEAVCKLLLDWLDVRAFTINISGVQNKS